MKIRIFDGELTHQNPTCQECNNHCYTLYYGGRKDRVTDAYYCKKCQTVYRLPYEKKCHFTEDDTCEKVLNKEERR